MNSLLSDPEWLKNAMTSTTLSFEITHAAPVVEPIVTPLAEPIVLGNVEPMSEKYDPKAMRPCTYDADGNVIKRKITLCSYEQCKNGPKCEFAHRKEEGYCVACWEDGHTMDSHRAPFCAWCCMSGHTTHACSDKKTRWCSSIYGKDDCPSGDDCEFAHDRSDIICSYCEFRGHGFAECANKNLTCLTCGEKRHSGVNRDVCEFRRPMKILSDDIQEIWIPDEVEPVRRVVPTISIVSASVHSQPIGSARKTETVTELNEAKESSQAANPIASELKPLSNSEPQVVVSVIDSRIASNGKRKMQMCPKGTMVPSQCPYGSRCFRAHDKNDAFCQACLKFGHTYDTGHSREKFCVFCQKDGHSTKKCQFKATRWCESVTQGVICPHRPHCTYAHKRDDLVCTFCEIRGHGLDECANSALMCSVCEKKGIIFINII